jgi:hypothetical protein
MFPESKSLIKVYQVVLLAVNSSIFHGKLTQKKGQKETDQNRTEQNRIKHEIFIKLNTQLKDERTSFIYCTMNTMSRI